MGRATRDTSSSSIIVGRAETMGKDRAGEVARRVEGSGGIAWSFDSLDEPPQLRNLLATTSEAARPGR